VKNYIIYNSSHYYSITPLHIVLYSYTDPDILKKFVRVVHNFKIKCQSDSKLKVTSPVINNMERHRIISGLCAPEASCLTDSRVSPSDTVKAMHSGSRSVEYNLREKKHRQSESYVAITARCRKMSVPPCCI